MFLFFKITFLSILLFFISSSISAQLNYNKSFLYQIFNPPQITNESVNKRTNVICTDAEKSKELN